MIKNYYRTLGLTIGASHEEIKSAYRTKAKKYHPDASGTTASQHKFLEAHRAYSFLISRNPDEVVRLVQNQNTTYQSPGSVSSDPYTYKQWKQESYNRKQRKPKNVNYLNFQKGIDRYISLMRWAMFAILGMSLGLGFYSFYRGKELANNTSVIIALILNALFFLLYIVGLSIKYDPKKKYRA